MKWIAAACAYLSIAFAAASFAAEDRASLEAAYQEADAAFAGQLTKLADRCRDLNDPALAAAERTTRTWRPPPGTSRPRYFLPRATAANVGDDAPLVVRQWHARFLDLRRKHAAELQKLARRASDAKHAPLAYAWLCESLRESPDDTDALRILDLLDEQGVARRLPTTANSPRVDHPKTNWRRGSYWRIETDHFLIQTNHSEAVAVEAAGRLEELHDVWRQLFFSFWTTPEALAARFAGRTDRLAPKRQHQVVLFKSRDEYVAKLKPSQAQIELTNGYYSDEQKTVYLYVGDDSTRPSWYHEVTHQLLQESLDVPTGVGGRANMWIVEGVATYMESLRRHDEGYVTLGGYDASRLQYARYARLGGSFYMPLAELTSLSRDALQKHSEIRSIYTQSAGLAQFLLDGNRGERRAATIDYLAAVYLRRDAADTLATKLGVTLEQLDQAYPEFLNVTDDELEAHPPAADARQLSLGRTSVTSRGLTKLPSLPKLEWLELNQLKIDDDAFAAFRESTALRQLFLENTLVTDTSLPAIARMTNLEELDLSGTKITDAGLPQLASLKKLKRLYLARCELTDAGLRSLQSLKQLESLDLSETQSTPAGIERLRKSLPKWKP